MLLILLTFVQLNSCYCD